MQLNTSITSLLTEWGNWSKAGTGLSLHVPNETLYADIDDELALVVDAAVLDLGVALPLTKEIIMQYYRFNKSDRTIATKAELSATKIRHLRSNGEAWLEGHLMAKGILIPKAA